MNNKLFTLVEVAVIAGLIVAVLFWGGVLKFGPEPTVTPTRPLNPTSPPRPTDTPSPLTPVPTHPLLVEASGLIAFESTRDGNSEIYVMNSDGSDQRNLTQNPADDTIPIWSPDGSRLAFFSTRSGYFEIYILTLADLSLSQVTDTHGTNTAYIPLLAWSPDGQYLLAARTDPWAVRGFYHRSGLDLIQLDTSEVTPLTEFDQALIMNLIWSPDSQHFAVRVATPSSYGIYLGDLNLRPFELKVTEGCFSGIWELTGRFSCYSDTNVYSINPDGSEHRFIASVPEVDDVIWSPDGKYLISFNRAYALDSQILRVLLPENSGLPDPLIERRISLAGYANQAIAPLSWSPAGQWITYDSALANHNNIYIANIFDAKNPIQLTQNSGNNYAPQWQP